MALSAIVHADMIVHTIINRQVGSIGPSTTANTGHHCQTIIASCFGTSSDSTTDSDRWTFTNELNFHERIMATSDSDRQCTITAGYSHEHAVKDHPSWPVCGYNQQW